MQTASISLSSSTVYTPLTGIAPLKGTSSTPHTLFWLVAGKGPLKIHPICNSLGIRTSYQRSLPSLPSFYVWLNGPTSVHSYTTLYRIHEECGLIRITGLTFHSVKKGLCHILLCSWTCVERVSSEQLSIVEISKSRNLHLQSPT